MKPKRPLRAGDPQLKLDVDGLNGFAAMMATMKEMGYESEEEEEGGESPAQQQQQPTGQGAPADVEAAGKASRQKQPAASARTSEKLVFVLIFMLVATVVAGLALFFILRANGTIRY